jgi:cysteinyl-tRNA synthetase
VLGVLQLEADFLQAGAEGRVDAAEVDKLIAARLAARARTGLSPTASVTS